MVGYAANTSAPLWFTQTSAKVAAGCPSCICFRGAGGGRGAVIGYPHPSLVSPGSGESGVGTIPVPTFSQSIASSSTAASMVMGVYL